MTLDTTNDAIGVAIGICTLIGIGIGYVRYIRPRWHKVKTQVVTARDAVIGRDAIVDNLTGETIADPVLGIGARMSSLEKHQAKQTTAIEHIATLIETQQAQDRRLDAQDARIDGHDGRIAALEEGAIERVANKAESISAFRAIEAVAKQGAEGPQVDPTNVLP